MLVSSPAERHQLMLSRRESAMRQQLFTQLVAGAGAAFILLTLSAFFAAAAGAAICRLSDATLP